jgi:hypothetical protein
MRGRDNNDRCKRDDGCTQVQAFRDPRLFPPLSARSGAFVVQVPPGRFIGLDTIQSTVRVEPPQLRTFPLRNHANPMLALFCKKFRRLLHCHSCVAVIWPFILAH